MRKINDDECLGHICRWFTGKPNFLCFKVGVLPNCSPELKRARKEKDGIDIRDRKCKWCGKITKRTEWGLCVECGRFQ